MDVAQVTLVDLPVQFAGVRARVLLVEYERGRTIVHLRAEDADDTIALTEESRHAVDGEGRALTHLASLSGGSGIETHVLHVFEGAPPERLVLLDSVGEPVIAIDSRP